MIKYYFNNNSFIVEDYLHASLFSSFLPAVAGVKGKPLWAFYNNRGQAMGGFGVNNKETPITPFDSANLCYQNIALKSFRTFIKINGKFKEAFSDTSVNTKMIINPSNISLIEETDEYIIEVTYSTVSNRDYAGLIRKVELKSKLEGDNKFEICDGLPIFFPHGLSNFCYKELVSLMAAYCQVFGLDTKMPFVKFKTSTGDCSIVSEVKDGNAFVSIDENNNRLNNVVDLYNIFAENDALTKPINFIDKDIKDLVLEDQQTENKLPCAFSLSDKNLKRDEKTCIYSIFGYFDSQDEFVESLGEITTKDIDSMIKETSDLIEDLLSPIEVNTNLPIFDLYAKQSLLDNSLRGGFPISLTNDDKNTYYVYSRKHGDMERDYNSFQIPSNYYSSGPGNFRDVLQNRRSDLYLYPFVKDYNIKTFFNLIQIDGQNPLNVAPNYFTLNEEYNEDCLEKEYLEKLKKGYYPSELYAHLKSVICECCVDRIFEDIINNSSQHTKANFAEGYWVDHWTYLVDLLENYRSIYPDKINDLLLEDGYKYFYSLVYVEPRSEKYSFVKENTIRQYGAIDLKKLKEECEKYNLDITKTYWLKDKDNKEITTNLLSKIFNLILVKFSTLDSQQMGIEMECEKPGWNDAMNGLPGMFASGMSETVELLRLVNFLLDEKSYVNANSISILKEQNSLFNEVNKHVDLLLSNKEDSFTYWDNVTTARENLRKDAHYNVSGELIDVDLDSIYSLLNKMKNILSNGIKKAKELFDGVLPSYLIYNVNKYEITDKVNHLGYKVVKAKSFELVKIPLFLEASARSYKLGKEFADSEEYLKIKETGVYDKQLKIYKTCASIDDAPFEIGRVHAFTKGWLERECDFLHMTYKYLLGLLKAGLYEEYYDEIKHNLVCFMDPEVYKRSPIENSSFIVPTCNPDKKLWGKGYFARLTGANAEFLDMLFTMFIGKDLFVLENNVLKLNVKPQLSKEFFKDGKASIKLFNKVTLEIVNKNNINAYEAKEICYEIEGELYKEVKGELANKVRNGSVSKVICIIE